MAQYKVPQDVEADDKLLGPFTFRQFVYLLIAGGLVALAVALFQLQPFLAILPIPPILLLLALSLPLKKDQPMETYLAALITFYLKPRKKFWTAGQPESTILITAPKVKEEVRTRNISGEEATHRLSFLANIVDTEGRAINDINSNSMRDDLVAEANSVADIFEENGQFNNIDTILEKDETTRHAEVMENMRKAIAASEAPLAPQPAPQPISPQPAAQATASAVSREFNPAAAAAPPVVEGPNYNSPVVILPNSPVKREERAPAKNPNEEPVYSASNSGQSPKKQAIIDLANNTDLPVSTLAKEAKRINRKDDSEVFISLH